jgi:cell division septation protein DedD
MIKRYRRHFFVLLENRAVPPTNNGSEQASGPASFFEKSPIVSDPNGPQSSTPTSDPSSKTPEAIGALQAIRLTLNSHPLPETG